MMYTRKCPSCNKDVFYKNQISFIKAKSKNSICKSCGCFLRPPKSIETRNKIAKTLTGKMVGIKHHFFGKHLSTEHKNKMSNTRKSKGLSKGEKNPMFNKTHSADVRLKISKITKERMNSPEIKEKMKKIFQSDDFCDKMSRIFKGRIVSDETRLKMRISAANRIQRLGKSSKNYNPNACRFMDEYGKQNGYNFRHALNGGEYHIKELGYFVDGYDIDNNVVFEYDEKRHFNRRGELKQKDKNRMDQIKLHLNCRFIRFNSKLDRIDIY